MIDRLAANMAIGIKRAVPDHPVSETVMKYSLALIINAVSIIGLSLAISFITGRVKEALLVLIFFAVLRQMSGGIHLKSGLLCIAVSTAGITLLSLASFDDQIVIGCTSVAACLMLAFAPSRIEKQTRIPKKYYPLLKWLSFLLVCSNFLIGSSVVGAAFLVQGMTLIRGRR